MLITYLFAGACFKEKQPSKSSPIGKEDRFRHVCFQPIADYGLYFNLKTTRALIQLSSDEKKITYQFKQISFGILSTPECKMYISDLYM